MTTAEIRVEAVRPEDPGVSLIKVSASSPPQAVAGSIYRAVLEPVARPVVRAVGAGAVAQAVKSIAIARGMVAPRGRDLACTIGFDNIIGNSGTEISAQTFHLFLR